MEALGVPLPLLAVLVVSWVASVCISILTWRRSGDPLLLKILITLVAFLPVLGPIFALWAISFPDRMHPSLQAKYPKRVNLYSVPEALLSRNDRPWDSVKAPHKRRRSVRRRRGGTT